MARLNLPLQSLDTHVTPILYNICWTTQRRITMPTIISYQKHIDAIITREAAFPVDAYNQRIGTELATISGTTYISLPDGVTLPADQPTEISATIQTVTPDAALILEIRAASPHVRLINQQVAQQIADIYSITDEIKLLRTAPSAEHDAYNAHAEACRAWGTAQKAALGL